MGGSVPRETNIAGQRHSLAYINPFEEDLLQKYRQDAPTVPGPGGIPSYMYGSTLESTKNVKSLQPSGPQQYTASSQRDESDRQADRDRNALAAANAKKSIDRKLASGTYTKNDDGSLAARSVNVAPTSAEPKVTASSNGQTASGGPTDKELRDAKIARQEQGRSALELFANKITPNDFMEYNLFGELVYQAGHPTVEAGKAKVGDAVRADETNSFGFTVGMGNTNTNDADPGRYRGGFGSGVKTDLDMTFAAGFGTPEEQKLALLRAGYTEPMADAYLAQTAASRANMGTGMGGGGGGGGGTNDIVQDLVTGIADPCPEGYKMDPVTNACVIDPDIGIGGPVFTPQDPNAVAGGAGTGYTQVTNSFIPTPLQPNQRNPVQQQLSALTSALQPKQNPQMQAGLGALPRRA